MNRCRFLGMLNSYLDNQLSDKQKLSLEDHIKSCSVCASELLSLKQVSEKLKSWHLSDLDANFDASVRNKIVARELERGDVKMKRKTWLVAVPSVAVAVLVVAFVGVLNKSGVQPNLAGGKIQQYEPYYLKSEKQLFDGRNKQAMRFVKAGRDAAYSEASVVNYSKSGAYAAADSLGLTQEVYGGFETLAEQKRMDIPAKEKIRQIFTEPNSGGAVIIVQPSLPVVANGEKIVRTALIRLEVADGNIAYHKALQVCQDLGGYAGSSNLIKDKEGRESGTIVMRIPKDKLSVALDKLGELGKIENTTNQNTDVSQVYANYKVRLDAAMMAYNKALEAMQKKQHDVEAALRLESELTPILQRVESIKRQIELLDNAIAYATITLEFHEPQVSEKVLAENKNLIGQELLKAQISAVKFFIGNIFVIAIVVILSVILLGAGVFFALIRNKINRRQ